MGNCVKFFSLLLMTFLVFGCASGKSSRTSDAGGKAEAQRHCTVNFENETVPHNAVSGKKLASMAHTAIGTPYVLGGSEPGGFDCSGLVKWTYESVGIKLPRTAREQSVVGKTIKSVKDMRAGDIVAFRHPRRGYHTGIYVGDGKFIHSPSKRTTVRINSLSDPYFSKTLLSARRINLTGGEDLVAQAESVLGSMPTPRSMRAHEARKSKQAAVSAGGKKTGKAGRTVAARKGDATKHGSVSGKDSKSKRLASSSRQKARTGKAVSQSKTGNSSKVAKNDVKTGKKHTVAKKRSSSSKIVAGKDNARQNAHKSVSMLHKKQLKTSARSRNRT